MFGFGFLDLSGSSARVESASLEGRPTVAPSSPGDAMVLQQVTIGTNEDGFIGRRISSVDAV